MNITYEEFENNLKDVVLTMELCDDLYHLADKYNKLHSGGYEFSFPSLADNIIKLLAIMTGDEQEWIYYWVYDLNCGKDSDKYRVTDKNGNIIPLTSIQNLWNLLVEQAEDNN